MTPEQIDLEFEHILIDKEKTDNNREVYVDSDYDDYDKESDELDKKLSDAPKDYKLPKNVDYNEDEWEDIDD